MSAATFLSDRRPAALCVIVALMAIVQLRVPYLNELQTHVIDAWRIWGGEIDCTAVYRLPLGYAGFIAPFMAFLGEPTGVKVANLLAFAGCAAAGLAYVAALSGQAEHGALRARWAGGLMLAAFLLYPYMIFNVARTTEAVPAAALVIAFLWAALHRPTLALAIIAGLCIGVGMQVRANMVSLLLPALLWLALRADGGWLRRAGLAAAGLGALIVSYSAVSLATTGCIWYSPTNGGYNLYAGNNPLSAEYLAADQNAEYSIIPSLRPRGIELADVPAAYEVPQADYVAWTREFVQGCPSCAVRLVLQKTVVYLSPRLKNAGGKAEVAVQWAMAAVTWLAFGLALWRFTRRRSYAEGIWLLVFVAYALPFVLTNADPRLRFPLDITALCYLAFILAGWLGAGRSTYDRTA